MPHRSFRDSTGETWEVFEVERSSKRRDSVRPQLVDGWLCFQRQDGHRVRVGKQLYPENWPDLDDAELERLAQIGLSAAQPRTVDLH